MTLPWYYLDITFTILRKLFWYYFDITLDYFDSLTLIWHFFDITLISLWYYFDITLTLHLISISCIVVETGSAVDKNKGGGGIALVEGGVNHGSDSVWSFVFRVRFSLVGSTFFKVNLELGSSWLFVFIIFWQTPDMATLIKWITRLTILIFLHNTSHSSAVKQGLFDPLMTKLSKNSAKSENG